MTDWQTKLDLIDIWEKSVKETEQTWMVPVWFIDELIKRLKTLLEEVKTHKYIKIRGMADELEDLIMDLESLKEDEGIPKEEFDTLWDKLYDWADTSLDGQWGGKKMCWIATMF